MDPLVGQVVGVLVGNAADKGAALAKEGGKAAIDAVGRLFSTVIGRLKGDPVTARTADGFEQDPEGYKVPVRDALADQVAADPAFAAELKALLDEVTGQAPGAVSLVVTGSGAAASHGGVAAGAGGIAIGGQAQVGGPLPSPAPQADRQDR
jgi:hypothetical protein